MRKLLYIIILAIVAGVTFAQVQQRQVVQQRKPLSQQPENRKIYLLHANTLSYDKTLDAERQVLKGEVQFRQDSVYMYCDSAYFWESTNSMQAFSNVRMVQGDTLSMHCDSMSYDGNRMFAELFDHVKLVHNTTVLTTEYMTYDRVEAVAHYPYSGTITDPDNDLNSMMGWYYPNTKIAEFRNEVVLQNYDTAHVLQATLYSDTLNYNFDMSEAEFLGPSRIVGDTATVYSTKGTFNTESQISHLLKRSSIVSSGRFATADSLVYDGLNGLGDGWGDIIMVDTLQSMKLTGEYMHYVDDPQSVLVTGRALAMEFSDKDTLYLHGDTLKAFTILNPDSIRHVKYDTLAVQELNADSIMFDTIHVIEHEYFEYFTDTLRYMTAHYGVRYYREDLQGVCDSLRYSVRDSMATFVGNPVMWNTDYQITGDTIYAFMNEQKSIDKVEIHNAAFLVQEKDTFTMHEVGPRNKLTHTLTRAYDQIKGKDLVCYFDSSKVRQMDMSGNVQIIFYPLESDGTMTGLIQTIGNYMSVWFKDQKMDKLKVWPDVVGSLTPIQLIQPDILYLDGYRWMDYLRPKDPMDVFRKIEMSTEDKEVETKPLFNQEELNGY